MNPLGANERVLFDEQLMSGALSTSVESSGATITNTLGVKRLNVTTAATNGSTAYVQSPTFTNTVYTAILFEAFDLTFNTSSIGFEMGLVGTASAINAKIRQDAASSDSSVMIHLGTSVQTQSKLNIRLGSEISRSKKVSVLFLRRSKEIYVFLNDGIYGYSTSTTWNGSANDVNLKLGVTARSDTATTASMSRIRAVVW